MRVHMQCQPVLDGKEADTIFNVGARTLERPLMGNEWLKLSIGCGQTESMVIHTVAIKPHLNTIPSGLRNPLSA